MKPRIDLVAFPTRESRTRYLAQRFAPILQGRVLDVGCFEAPLRQLLPDIEYVGVDLAGNPDIVLDIDRSPSLPFRDAAYDCALCVHVLEHVDNLHRLLDELIRVSRRYVLIALPNCWRGARRAIERGEGAFRHYGLPLSPPSDRHKWFFSLSQALGFLTAFAEQQGLLVQELLITDNPKAAPIRWARRIRYPGMRYHNRYSNTIWVVYEKPAQ
jgi:SAM-dependent methyltransferase